MTIKEAEIKYKQQGLLSIEKYKHTEQPFSEFLLNFVSNLNIMYNTMYLDQVHTRSNRARSIGDIYRICLSYYPNLNLLELRNEITNLIQEGEIVGHFCPDIKKNVYLGKRARPYWIPSYGICTDEHDWDIRQYAEDIEEEIQRTVSV